MVATSHWLIVCNHVIASCSWLLRICATHVAWCCLTCWCPRVLTRLACAHTFQCDLVACAYERLAEYGWKPHRDFLARAKQSPAPFTGICVKHRGVRFHRIRDFKLYYFNSVPPTSQCSVFGERERERESEREREGKRERESERARGRTALPCHAADDCSGSGAQVLGKHTTNVYV